MSRASRFLASLGMTPGKDYRFLVVVLKPSSARKMAAGVDPNYGFPRDSRRKTLLG
jgi:hypothetical protein